jgi:dienelactone hydrolase
MQRFIFCLTVILCLKGAALGHAADARQDFLKLIDRPRVALDPELKEKPSTNKFVAFTEIRFSYAVEAGKRVPGILLKPTNFSGRRPAVIVMHGTGGRKEDERSLLVRLVEKGFIAVAIDGRYHGERATNGPGSESYQAAIVRAWNGSGEHPFFYDTIWDIMRLIDYLDTRDDVDAARIGLTGISKGGVETYLTAAVDPRVAVAAPLIGVQSFHWALANKDWQGRIGTIQGAFDKIAHAEGVTNVDAVFVQKFYDRIVPNIYAEFDGPQMVPLIAPRPLLVINSDGDKNCPLPGVRECLVMVQKAYQAEHARDHFFPVIQPNTGHAVRPESEGVMINWFEKWLKP